MTKKWLVAILLLSAGLIAQSVSPPKAQKGTAGKIAALEARVAVLEQAFNENISVLDARTWDLHARLKHFEDQEGNGPEHKALLKALAELNEVDARVAQLERPEVEDDAK